MSNLKIENWVTAYWRRKLAWAHRITAHDPESLAKKVTEWRPEWDLSQQTVRAQSRPRMRWDDEIQRFLREVLADPCAHWMNIAGDSSKWSVLSQQFLNQKQESFTNSARQPVKCLYSILFSRSTLEAPRPHTFIRDHIHLSADTLCAPISLLSSSLSSFSFERQRYAGAKAPPRAPSQIGCRCCAGSVSVSVNTFKGICTLSKGLIHLDASQSPQDSRTWSLQMGHLLKGPI